MALIETSSALLDAEPRYPSGKPGPAALTEGVRQIHAILARVAGVEVDPRLAPAWPLDRDLGR